MNFQQQKTFLKTSCTNVLCFPTLSVQTNDPSYYFESAKKLESGSQTPFVSKGTTQPNQVVPTSGSLERRVTRGGDSFLLRLVTKSVSCPIISMYFIRTLTTGHSSNTLTSVL